MESSRGFEHRPTEQPGLSQQDRLIQEKFLDEVAGKVLIENDPVTWIRAAVALDTQRGASEISDRELYIRYMEGGKVEWDPLVVKSVRRYLKDKGF